MVCTVYSVQCTVRLMCVLVAGSGAAGPHTGYGHGGRLFSSVLISLLVADRCRRAMRRVPLHLGKGPREPVMWIWAAGCLCRAAVAPRCALDLAGGGCRAAGVAPESLERGFARPRRRRAEARGR